MVKKEDNTGFQWVILFSLIVSICLPVMDTFASVTPWVESEYAKSRVITVGKGGDVSENTIYLGIEIHSEPGWKLYWRTPGDSGLAPMIEWEHANNIKETHILWPAPVRSVEVIDGITMESFVYKEKLILPVVLTPQTADQTMQGTMLLNYAVCKEICIPVSAEFSVDVQPGYADADQLQRMRPYIAKVPVPNGDGALRITDVRFYQNEEGKQFIDVAAAAKDGFRQPDVLIESDSLFRFRKPEVDIYQENAVLHVPVEAVIAGSLLPVGKTLTLTLSDDGHAVEHQVTIEAATVRNNTPDQSFWIILAFAFIGGLILNIMPCVLPVLSIKLLGVIKHGGKETRPIRTSFLVSALGIVVSFIVVGSITLVLKSLGNSVGWGFHFQSMEFLIALVLILVLFAANMAGRFEITLPVWFNNLAAKHGGSEHSLPADFMTGVLATILATPCSAPFLGTAVSFALSRGAIEILVIFSMMGVGLAFPYLLFALFPQWARKLPKPGAWMNKVKYIMAILLGLTAFWLLWVMYHSSGIMVAVTVFLSALLLKFFVELKTSVFAKPLLRILSIVLVLWVAFAIPSRLADLRMAHEQRVAETWIPFDEASIPALVAEGKIVFVDVTADWCLTCKFNKIRVLDRPYMTDKFKELGVVAMRADLTKPNPVIVDYLKRNGRYGIPFNIIYGSGAPEGIPLSELISNAEIDRALKKALSASH